MVEHDRPLVSVVLPSRDRPAMVAQALRSALAQQEVDAEVVVIDDGSAVKSTFVAEQVDRGRVRMVTHDTPRGVAAARNSGLAMARGEWVAFLDDDDLLAPDCLAAHVRALRLVPGAVWSCSGSIHIDLAGRIVGYSVPPEPGRVAADLRWWNVIPAPCCVVLNRRALEAAGPFDPAFSSFADWDVWIRMAEQGPLATVSRPLAAYRVHQGNMSADPGTWESERSKLMARHGIDGEPEAGRHAGARDRTEAWNYLRKGWPARSRTEMWKLARHRRDWRAALCAAGIGAAPQVMVRIDAARRRPAAGHPWRREADAWLEPFRPAGLPAGQPERPAE